MLVHKIPAQANKKLNSELNKSTAHQHLVMSQLLCEMRLVSARRTKADSEIIQSLLEYAQVSEQSEKKHYQPMANVAPTSSNNKASNKPLMNVLLIEDSALIRNVIGESLEDCKDILISAYAETQHHAIELLKVEAFDMLLVDIELAQGNGYEVIKYTQSAEYRFAKPVIIMLTNNASPYYRMMAKELGIKFFFDKSMDFDLAIETIANEAFKFTHPH